MTEQTCICEHLQIDHSKVGHHFCQYKGCGCQGFIRLAKKPFKNDRTPCECVFCWRYKRQPRNFDIVHLFEALMDSANQLLVRENYDGVADRIHRVIGICRELIREEPTRNFSRCRFRITNRMRCNLPLVNLKCVDHGYQGMNDTLDNYGEVIK